MLAVLVVAGIYMPRRSKTEAGPKPASSDANGTNASPQAAPASNPSPANSSQPATPEAAAPNSVGQVAAQPQSSNPAAPAPENAKSGTKRCFSGKVARCSYAHSSGQQQRRQPGCLRDGASFAQANAAPAANDAASLDAAERDVDQLSNRAVAINGSLDRLQQQQSAAGYGLRGDIAARQASMKNNLAKAQSALQSGDLQRAKKYTDLAQGDVDALEHFLGH